MLHLKEVRIPYENSFSLDSYKEITPEAVEAVQKIGHTLKGRPVIHVNATPVGGGVAELLQSQIIMERSLGIESHWLVIEGAPVQFFDVTKKIHNLFQSKPGTFTEEEQGLYLRVTDELADSLSHHLKRFQNPLIIVHDPQPLGIIQKENLPRQSMVLRLHIELSSPNQSVLKFFRPYIEMYSKLVLSSEEYIPAFSWYDRAKIEIIAPAIDPYTEKNTPMNAAHARKILTGFGIDSSKPLLTQVSRFDPWKDPVGVIEAFREIKKKIPNVQLALAGFITAKDDPEAVQILKEVEKARGDDAQIFLFSDPAVLGDITNDEFIAALYTASDVVFQKSLREGFGLTSSEAMWKNKAVVSGNTVGGRMQIEHGVNGFLVQSPKEAADAALILLQDKKIAKKMGKAAHETVREKFIITRYLLEHLNLYAGIASKLPKIKKVLHSPHEIHANFLQ